MCYGLSRYLDSTWTIPEQWIENTRKTCENLQMSHLFHYNTAVGGGYAVLFPTFYLIKAYKMGKGQKMKLEAPTDDTQTASSWPEIVLRFLVPVSVEIFIYVLARTCFYEDGKITLLADYMVKKALRVVLLCLAFNSRTLETTIHNVCQSKTK